MGSDSRSRDARERAEEALVRFALLSGEHALDFVVIGGLNPDFLAPGAPVAHQGTTDVDILLELGLVYDRDDIDFGWLDNTLSLGGFTDVRDAWRWRAGGIRVDLLCDVSDSRGQTIALPGARRAAAQNLDGPAAALKGPVTRAIPVSPALRRLFPEASPTVTLRFASLGGYIAAKSAALIARNLDKDAYDLVFVMMYAPGGPEAVAEAARGVDSDPLVVRSAIGRFTAESGWTKKVVALLVNAGDDSDEQVLTADVAVAARRFLSRYEIT